MGKDREPTMERLEDGTLRIPVTEKGLSWDIAFRVAGIGLGVYKRFVEPALYPPLSLNSHGRLPIEEVIRLHNQAEIIRQTDPLTRRKTRVEFNLSSEILIYKL